MAELTEPQYAWLSVLSGKTLPPPAGVDRKALAAIEFQKLRAGEDRAELALKAMMLEQAAEVVELDKKKIRAAFTFKVEHTDAKSDKTTQLNSKGPQHEALDTREIRHDSVIDQGKVSAQKECFATIMKEQDKLEQKTVDRTEAVDPTTMKAIRKPHPLFEAKEIMVGFYTPMVREDVLPENFVPPRFSETQTMLDGSNDEYLEEIKEKGKTIDTGAAGALKSALQLAGAVTDAILTTTTGVSVTDGVKSLSSTSNVGLSSEWQTRAVAITDGVVAVLTAAVDGADAAVTAYTEVKYDQGQWQTIANAVATAVGKIVAGGFGDATLGGTVADGLATGIGALSVGSTVITWAKSHPRGPFPLSDLMSGLGAAVGSGMSVGSDVTNDGVSKMFVIITQEVTAGFNIASKVVSAKFADLVTKGEVGQAFAMLGETAVAEGCKAVAGGLAGFKYDDKSESLSAQTDASGKPLTAQDQVHDLEKIVVTGQKTSDTITKAFDESAMDTLNEAVAAEFDAKTGTRMAELAKNAKEADGAQVQAEQLAAEKQAYVEALERLTADEPMGDEDFKSIAQLTKKIESDKAIVKMAYGIAQLGLATPGVAVAAQFVAPLKAAGDLVKFVQNLHASVERIIALQKWNGSKREASSARSPYLTSIENFIKNNQELLTHHSIQAILLLARSIAGFADTAFPAAKAAVVAFDLAVTLEDAVFTVYKHAQLVKAWEATERALDDPQNRKLGLIARGLNPTLAKYAIAYGAVVAKNATAVSAMSKVGLDRESLMRPNAKVREVKDFLEKLYDEDNVVLGKRKQAAKSLKLPKAELKMKTWSTAFYILQNPPPPAEGQAQIAPVISPNPKSVLAGLTRLETGRDRIEKLLGALKAAATIKDQDQQREAVMQEAAQQEKVLQGLEMTWRGLEPLTTAGSSYDAARVAAEYADLAGAECTLVRINLTARLAEIDAEHRAKALAPDAESEDSGESEEGSETDSDRATIGSSSELSEVEDEDEDEPEDLLEPV